MGYEPGEDTIRETLESARHLRRQCRLDEAELIVRRMLMRSDRAARHRANLLKELAEIEIVRGTWSEAARHLDTALSLLAGDDSDAASRICASASERKAWALFRQGNGAGARKTAEAALIPMKEEDHPAAAAGLHNTLGGIAWQQGRQDEAIAQTMRAAELFEAAGDDAGAATARTNIGILLFSAGRWDEAEREFERADEMRRAMGCDAERPRGLVNLAILEMARGKRDEARSNLAEAMRLGRELGQRYITARAELALAELELLDGNADEASSHLGAAADADCLCDDDRLEAARLQALIECDRGGTGRAIELAEQARTLARNAGLVESEADCCRALGVAYRRSENYDQAQRTFSDAVALAEQIGNPYRRALALLELGDVSRDRKNVTEAAAVFRSLGANADLARATALLA